MKKYLILISLVFVFFESLTAQCVGIKKYEIGQSGCSAYFRTAPDSVGTSQMEDGSIIYTTSAFCDNITYGIVLIKFKTTIGIDKQKQIEIAESYCEILKGMLNMTNCAGYGTGHEHSKNTAAQGIIDYCDDASGNECKIKAWVDADYTALMYVFFPKTNEENNNYNLQELFLNGFCFPGN